MDSKDPVPAVNTKEKREKSEPIQPKIVTVKEESPKKHDKSKASDEEPKPRIVLTFRSEKPGIKSSNMKIVSTEEKHEETTVRRSTRAHGADEDEAGTSKTSVYESDDATSDTSSTTPKRSVRNKNKDHGDNIIASAIARKEKSYNETTPSPAPSQRLSRRIKPTAKILANKELRIGLETQNNVRLGITAPTDKSPEEGVQTRRSLRRRSPEATVSEPSSKIVSPGEVTPKKRKLQKEELEPKVTIEISPAMKEQEVRLNKMKKKHLSKLGLQAIEGEPREANEESQSMDSTNTEAVAEHLNAQNEAMDVDIEEMDEEGQDAEDEDLEDELANIYEEFDDSSDEEFSPAQQRTPRRSLRSAHDDSKSSQHRDSLDDSKEPPRRRSSRLRRPQFETSSPYASEPEEEEAPEEVSPPEGSEGSEAACPDERPAVLGACLCEAPSNVYAAPSELEEPVFCRAIETSPSGRVGCSHPARRLGTSHAPLLRAGPRTPYALLCELHTSLLRKHMCCTTCGLFCTQGIFYRCSLGHFFHVDCGLTAPAKAAPGCPHCGLLSYQWQRPANCECRRVRLRMDCSGRRQLLHEQRVTSQPAFLSFSTLDPSQLDHEPYIPEDLLPKPPIDIKSLKAQLSGTNGEVSSAENELKLRDAIINFETAEELISKIMSVDVSKPSLADSCLHLAAQSGNLTALYLLQYAGADLNAQDQGLRTPLMAAISALLEKSSKKSTDKSSKASTDKDKDTDSVSSQEKEDKESERDSTMDGDDVIKPNEENLMKVIRYLIAAGCDVNVAGPEGMTALHLAAQWGGRAVAAAILSSAAAVVDARDHGGWTPLVWAAENNHPAVLTTLLSAGADASAADAEGNGALHWCALAGAAAALRLLADTGADVSAPNVHSDTPLHVAARQGHYPCVIILLARGARTDIENSAGELPVEVCRGDCQSAISLNMQLALSVRDCTKRFKLITSDISNGHETYPIPCVNEIDDSAPEPFTYVTRHVMPTRIAVDNTLPTMQGCNCTGTDCSASACSCAAVSVRRWWGGGGRLLPSFPYHEPPMIFECNYTCGCRLNHCTNTTITKLTNLGATFVRTVVFKRRRGGWGLRAARALLRGAPAAAYIGELLPADEADTRTMDQYMFGLHLKPTHIEQCVEKTQLCVDAAVYGSAARFINHSCRPNLAPVRVFTNTRDLRLPTITLFATRDIAANEELTFDYGDKFWSVKSKLFKCECGEPECRYPTVTQDESKSETVEN